ncbi:MAG: hypothetical protein AAB375_01400 [Patescibacteria group bacterium]
MLEPDSREGIRQTVLTTYRHAFQNILEGILRTTSLQVNEAVAELQRSAIYQYEEAKQRASPDESRLLEWQEVALLELIASIGRDIAR